MHKNVLTDDDIIAASHYNVHCCECRKDFARFVSRIIKGLEKTVEEEKSLIKNGDDARLRGMIKYHSTQVSTLRWLLSMNDSRTLE